MRRVTPYHILPFLLLLALLAGCSLPWSQQDQESNPTAEAILKQGIEDLNNKKYERAIAKFEKVRDEFPFSPQVTEAELKISEAHYLNKQYPEAALGFKDFLALRPTNENVAFVIYRLGLVHFKQFSSIDRDQKHIESAKGYFETLIKDHPNSDYTADAKEKLAKCRQYLAERQFYIGSFYLREKKYPAARERFEIVVRGYLDTSTGVKALYQLGESYRLEKNNARAALAYEALIQHYPDSALAEKARSQLSQLDKEKQDPLAMLLMRDGRPVVAAPSQVSAEVQNRSTEAHDRSPKSEIQNRKDLNLVAKKEVVHEEGGVKKGFFRRVADTINPFASSEEKEDENKKKENPKQERRGFFGSLWPFGKKEEAKIDEEGDGQLVTQIDESLKEKGIATPQNRPPTPDLPQITEEPTPPSNTAEVLGQIDESLKKDGKSLAEPPPPPEVSSKLFATRPSKTKKKRSPTSPSTAGLLGTIDKGLKRKGIEPPEASPPSPASAASEQGAGSGSSGGEAQEKVELSPRLTMEKKPFFLDAGEYQVQEKPEEDEEKESEEASRAKASQPLKELPKSVVKGPPSPPSKEKPAETKVAEGPEEEDEESKGALDQIKEDLRSLRKLLNPFSW